MVDPQIPVDASLQAGIDGQLPGKRTDPASMLRVDQAGEYGATRIYAGQLAVMGDRHPDARVIRRMAQQEERHREILDKLLLERGARPTALQPMWKMAGFGLGAAPALTGRRPPEAAPGGRTE